MATSSEPQGLGGGGGGSNKMFGVDPVIDLWCPLPPCCHRISELTIICLSKTKCIIYNIFIYLSTLGDNRSVGVTLSPLREAYVTNKHAMSSPGQS